MIVLDPAAAAGWVTIESPGFDAGGYENNVCMTWNVSVVEQKHTVSPFCKFFLSS